ncbi:DUF2726 domain-containing protein [Shewanella sp. AS16]|uniref:DUF2726 domain-containing protein n=1 Tax=Shewanella sp. AS16 TaxID=2907625 RepID=UPI001F227AA6|nr:DUF2726 domain-containing protein [Shewanella sp. AS16]MCE9685497.1 DUF2726 domain-containing protein [Shewanella sp. AS16]
MNTTQLVMIAAAFLFIILAPLLMRLLVRLLGSSTESDYQYRKQKTLFSAAERSFLGVLDRAIGEQYRVLGKVRIADVITPEKGMSRKHWQSAFNKISAKHFDYLLCDKHTLEAIAAIELDDSSHKRTKTQSRDQLIAQACQSACLPLIRFDAKRSYQLATVRTTIYAALPSGLQPAFANETQAAQAAPIAQETSPQTLTVDKI